MILSQKRVRSLDSHLDAATLGKQLRVAVSLTNHREKLKEIGFPDPPIPGQVLLPSSSFGPSCRFNAEGKQIPQRHLPKETLYRTQMWTHTEYHGDEAREVESLVSIPYQRYPRIEVPPPSVELTIVAAESGELYIATNSFVYGSEDVALLSGINVLLELFGLCEVQLEDGSLLKPPRVQSLDWEVLPAGDFPWVRVKRHIQASFRGAKPHTLAAIEWRMEKLWGFAPTHTLVGRSGFDGYVIFCFPELGLNVLECRRPDNATYVLGENWLALSQLTKAQILQANLHLDRVLHTTQWESRISRILTPPRR